MLVALIAYLDCDIGYCDKRIELRIDTIGYIPSAPAIHVLWKLISLLTKNFK